MKLACSNARNTTAAAASFGLHGRPTGRKYTAKFSATAPRRHPAAPADRGEWAYPHRPMVRRTRAQPDHLFDGEIVHSSGRSVERSSEARRARSWRETRIAIGGESGPITSICARKTSTSISGAARITCSLEIASPCLPASRPCFGRRRSCYTSSFGARETPTNLRAGRENR